MREDHAVGHLVPQFYYYFTYFSSLRPFRSSSDSSRRFWLDSVHPDCFSTHPALFNNHAHVNPRPCTTTLIKYLSSATPFSMVTATSGVCIRSIPLRDIDHRSIYFHTKLQSIPMIRRKPSLWLYARATSQSSSPLF